MYPVLATLTILLYVPSLCPSCTATHHTACTQAEVNEMFVSAKAAQKAWARTPLWKRAEILKKAAALMRTHAQPMADCMVKEVAKAAKDSLTEVIRSADLIDYTAEEAVRVLGAGELLNSDSFPGHGRNKLCLVSKVRAQAGTSVQCDAMPQSRIMEGTLRHAQGHTHIQRRFVVAVQASD